MDTTRRMRIDKAALIEQLRQAADHLEAGVAEDTLDVEGLAEAASVAGTNVRSDRMVPVPQEVYAAVHRKAAELKVPVKNLWREMALWMLPRLKSSE